MYRTLIILVTAILLVGIAAIILYFGFNNSNDRDIKMSIIKDYEIQFDELDETIYIRAKSWGIAGNHNEILLSNSPIDNLHGEYFVNRQLTFLDTTAIYYKKIGTDTLAVYVEYAEEVPQEFNSKVKIQQLQLSGSSENRKHVEHYLDNGLTKVSTF